MWWMMLGGECVKWINKRDWKSILIFIRKWTGARGWGERVCVLTFWWWWWWLITSTPSSSSWSKSSSRWSALYREKKKRKKEKCEWDDSQFLKFWAIGWNLPSAMADDDEPQPIKSDDVSWCVVRSCFTSSKPMSPRCIIILDMLAAVLLVG